MSTKVLFKILVPFGLLVVIFLAAQIVSSKSASAPAGGDTVTDQGLVAPDMIELRSDSLKSNNLAGDDYFQRHASEYSADSNNMAFDDYFQRHASEYPAGSNNMALDDYFQRHASDYSAGSDYIERHPPVRWSQKPGHSFGVP